MTTTESQNKLVEILRSLGLTRYEALAYIGLVRVGGGTATRISEISGVPRASVYPALDRLIQKDMVSISNSNPRRYRATPPDECIKHRLGQLEGYAEEAITALLESRRRQMKEDRTQQELIWSIYGKEHIIDRLVDLITPVRKEVRLIAHWYLLSEGIAELLLGLSPDIVVEVICDRWEGDRNPSISIRTASVPMQRDCIPPHDMSGIFIVDEKQVLVIMGSGDEPPSALFSESEGFVQFFSRYYRLVLQWTMGSAQ